MCEGACPIHGSIFIPKQLSCSHKLGIDPASASPAHPQMKWKFLSICLLLSWCTGFLLGRVCRFVVHIQPDDSRLAELDRACSKGGQQVYNLVDDNEEPSAPRRSQHIDTKFHFIWSSQRGGRMISNPSECMSGLVTSSPSCVFDGIKFSHASRKIGFTIIK